MRWLMAFSLMQFGCNTGGKTVLEVDEGATLQDNDGDGYVLADDCDENNPSVNISAEELCDGIDNNCDGVVDEGVLTTYYLDYDEDGFGDDNRTLESCSLPVGYVPNGNDCDDSEPTVFQATLRFAMGWTTIATMRLTKGLVVLCTLTPMGMGLETPTIRSMAATTPMAMFRTGLTVMTAIRTSIPMPPKSVMMSTTIVMVT